MYSASIIFYRNIRASEINIRTIHRTTAMRAQR